MRVKMSLVPKDEDDERNAILEVRAGTGGDEAALFAAELFRMYQRYAALKGWKFELIRGSIPSPWLAGRLALWGVLWARLSPCWSQRSCLPAAVVCCRPILSEAGGRVGGRWRDRDGV